MNQGAAETAMAKNPSRCPYCGGENLEGNGVDIQDDARKAQQEVTCQDCTASFYLNFKIESADLINPPDEAADDEEG
jgi:transposase-like protein